MRTYTITKKTDDLKWDNIPKVSIDNICHTGEVDIEAWGQLCYDEDFLYVKLSAREENIRAEYNGPLDPPCQDSCLEFFFSPMEDDGRYFNIEMNPNCCVYFGFGSSIKQLMRLIPEGWDPLCPKANRTDDGWEVSYQVPFSLIQTFFPDFKAESGKRMRANFYKCGDLTVKEHYFTWNPITGDELSFHRPCDFGLVIFE